MKKLISTLLQAGKAKRGLTLVVLMLLGRREQPTAV